jgi:hypothetical protein
MSEETLKQYSDSTSGVLGYLKKQLGGVGLWQNVPGQFSKMSSSSAGYVWGLTASGELYVCREPCSAGTWTAVPLPNGAKVVDITTDATSVYAHTVYAHTGTSSDEFGMLVKSAANDGDWGTIPAPFLGDEVTNTNGYLWLSGQGKTAFCAKPCTAGGWNVRDGDNRRLLGGGGSTVFATEPGTLNVMKTDETAQTGWQSVGGLEGSGVSTLAAEADNTVLYAANDSKLFRCEGTCETPEQLEVVNAQGFVPLRTKGSLTVNPSSKNVWMAASSSGVNGNVFARLDRPDAEPILEVVDQTDAARDRVFNSLGGSIEIQTAKMASRMARDQAASAIQTTLDLSDKQQETDNQIRMLKRKIDTEKGMAAGYRDKTTPLIILVAALALTLAVYLLLGWLLPTSVTMGIAFVVLAAGFGAAIYFSVVR